jgi:hypothetical protein
VPRHHSANATAFRERARDQRGAGDQAPWRSTYAERKPVSGRVNVFPPTGEDLAILRGVIYSSVFDYPLSAEELWRSLPRVTMPIDAMTRAIAERPFLRDRIERIDGWYVPAGGHDLIQRRRDREAASRAFLQAHRGTLNVICALPFTRLVAISGSLAHLNADKDADLDLFIVTSGARVWTVALSLVAVARLIRRRNVVCANFLLADSHLSLDQHDLYTASQVLHLRPVIGARVFDQFLAANPFVHDWFPNARSAGATGYPLPVSTRGRSIKRVAELLLWIPSALIERVCRSLYGWHLQRRVSRWRSPDQVRLERECLKLHTNSHRAAVLARFDALFERAVKGQDIS